MDRLYRRTWDRLSPGDEQARRRGMSSDVTKRQQGEARAIHPGERANVIHVRIPPRNRPGYGGVSESC